MFRRMTESHNQIQSILINTLEQLNIDFSITSMFPGVNKPDVVIENENKNYIIDITMAFDCQENMFNANARKWKNIGI